MSDHHLPDDVGRWPRDPYALLGVPSTVSLRDLKKAYTRLIRLFRPEEFPEHFRRIRDAYETVQFYAKFQSVQGADAADDMASQLPPLSNPPPLDPSPNLMPTSAYPMDKFAEAPPRQDDLAQLWEQACGGDQESVYRRMRQIYNEDPRRTEVLPRLYWLLHLFPDLDRVRHPCDWLAESLRVSGLAAPVRELYRRYLVNHPEEALSERYARLLESPAPAFQLSPLLEWRWRAAGRLRNSTVIETDLEMFGPRLQNEDEDTWVRLLFLAADELAWFVDERAGRLFDGCRRDLEKLEHMQSRHGESFARLDFLTELSQVWKQTRQRMSPTIPYCSDVWWELLNLIPLTWTNPMSEVRVLVLEAFAPAWAKPDAALGFLDDVQRQAQLLLAQILRTLETLLFGWSQRPVSWPADDEIERRTQRFLATVSADKYAHFRQKLCVFCFQEWLPPERMAEVMATRSNDANVIGLFTQVRNDWPLRCLCLAHRVFWA